MQCVSAVPSLRALVLGHTRVQDTGLAMLAALSALTHVTFTAEAITNAGLLVSCLLCSGPHATELDGMFFVMDWDGFMTECRAEQGSACPTCSCSLRSGSYDAFPACRDCLTQACIWLLPAGPGSFGLHVNTEAAFCAK